MWILHMSSLTFITLCWKNLLDTKCLLRHCTDLICISGLEFLFSCISPLHCGIRTRCFCVERKKKIVLWLWNVEGYRFVSHNQMKMCDNNYSWCSEQSCLLSNQNEVWFSSSGLFPFLSLWKQFFFPSFWLQMVFLADGINACLTKTTG